MRWHAATSGSSGTSRNSVVLSSSSEEEDILASYRCGANSFVRKPLAFAEFAETVAQLAHDCPNIVGIKEAGGNADRVSQLRAALAQVAMSATGVIRLQAGPYASRDEARAGAERVREALQLVPLVVERR